MGVPHYRILAITFTNKAANEMKKRVAELLGDRDGIGRDDSTENRSTQICGILGMAQAKIPLPQLLWKLLWTRLRSAGCGSPLFTRHVRGFFAVTPRSSAIPEQFSIYDTGDSSRVFKYVLRELGIGPQATTCESLPKSDQQSQERFTLAR